MITVNSTEEETAIARFLEHCQRRQYKSKSVIINAGEPSTELYYIVKGSVAVLIEDDRGHEVVLSYLNDGDFFGEVGLFDKEQSRTARVRARTECDIAFISYDKFRSASSLFPDLLFSIASQMSIRLRKTSRKVGDLVFMDVTGRIARALLELCQEPDAMTHPQGMQIRITRQELGRIVGCSREMVGRVLKNLEEQGIISVKGKTIVVFEETRMPGRVSAAGGA